MSAITNCFGAIWGEPGRARTTDWIFAVAILGILFLVVCLGLVVSFFVLRELAEWLSHP
jgi:hypothetical protein